MEKTGFSSLANFLRKRKSFPVTRIQINRGTHFKLGKQESKKVFSIMNLHERPDRQFDWSSHFEKHDSLAVILIETNALCMFSALILIVRVALSLCFALTLTHKDALCWSKSCHQFRRIEISVSLYLSYRETFSFSCFPKLTWMRDFFSNYP